MIHGVAPPTFPSPLFTAAVEGAAAALKLSRAKNQPDRLRQSQLQLLDRGRRGRSLSRAWPLPGFTALQSKSHQSGLLLLHACGRSSACSQKPGSDVTVFGEGHKPEVRGRAVRGGGATGTVRPLAPPPELSRSVKTLNM